MDKTFIYGLFETLTVSAVGRVYRLPADTLNKNKSKNNFFAKNRKKITKNKLRFPKIKKF
jgi:hypothetical protein